MRALFVFVCALACSACMQETVRFQAKPHQQAITRDGQPALISQAKSSLVMIRPAMRRFASDARPVFVVAVRNLADQPIEFQLRNVSVTQMAGLDAVPMKVFSYDELVAEQETRQVVTALLVGAAAGVNAAVAAQEGYRTQTTTVNAPSGSYTYESTSYNPSSGLAAQKRAWRQNERLIGAAIKQGRSNLAALEREVIKDNTMMPGEWYGGTLHVEPPADAGGATASKRYAIAMTVGPDRHEFDVMQESVK